MVSAAHRQAVVLSSAFGSSLAPFMVAGVVVALPAIGGEFSLDTAGLSWLTNVFFLAAAAFLVPFGRLADVRGVKRVFRIGIGIYLVASVICVTAPSALVLMAGRFLTGAGAAMIFSTTIALLSLVFPENERGKAIGINVSGMVIGFSAGFAAGGLLTYYVGWRTIFLVTIPVEILVFWLITRIRGECALARDRHLDPGGSALYTIMILLSMTGFSMLAASYGKAALAVGIVVFAFFVLWERRVASPMIDLGLFRSNRLFLVGNIADLIYFVATFAPIFLLSLYLQNIRGLDARIAGVLLLIPSLCIIAAVYTGRLADRYSGRTIALVGYLITIPTLVFFIFIDADTPLLLFIGISIVFGLGTAFVQPSLAKIVVSSVDRARYGTASGTIETMRLIGNTLSTAVATIVFTLAPAALLTGLHLLFAIYAGLTILGTGVVLGSMLLPINRVATDVH
ncbi:MAG: MFS transporter [Methanomicrobiales archaeon]|nr:MFS transporter [Methanomicrobiales archaeon]